MDQKSRGQDQETHQPLKRTSYDARWDLLLQLAWRAGFLDDLRLQQARHLCRQECSPKVLVRREILSSAVLQALMTMVKEAPAQVLAKASVPPASCSEQPRAEFGRYQLINPIGRGGMGVVYKAFDPQLQRTVALKTMRLDEEEDTVLAKRFEREARLSAGLQHPNIVPVYESGLYGGHYFFTMKYIDGVDLRQYCQRHRLDLKARLQLLHTVALALHYAHEHGIVHRDIKPSNILVDQQGQPYLMDFGLARSQQTNERLTLTGMALGTPAYMSPEQAQGKRTIDHRSDIYSLGAVMYELLSGRPPFGQIVLAQYLEIIAQQDPPSLRPLGVPREVEAICRHCLAKEPRQRYASARALAADLQAYGEGRPLSVRPPRWYHHCWHYLQRRRLLVLTILHSGLLLGLLGLWNWWQHQTAREKLLRELYHTSQAYYQQGDYLHARVNLRKILELAPREQSARLLLAKLSNELQLLLQQGRTAEQKQEWEKAQQCYERLLRHDPSNQAAAAGRCIVKAKIEACKAYGLLRQQNARLAAERQQKQCRARALIPYEQAMELYYSPHSSRAKLLQCIDQLTQALAQDPSFAQAYFQRGRLYHRLAYFDKALADYRQCRQLNPQLFAPQYYHAKILYRLYVDRPKGPARERAGRRLQYFLQGVGTPPQGGRYQELFRALQLFAPISAQGLKASERIEHDQWRALEQAHKIQSHYPLFPQAYFLTAEIGAQIVSQGHLQRPTTSEHHQPLLPLQIALQAVNRGLALEPYNPNGYACRGNLELMSGEFQAAMDDFDRALALNHISKPFYYQRIICNTILNKFPAALQDLEEFRAKWTETYEYYMFLGYYHLLYGDLAKGADAFSRAIQAAAPDELDIAYISRGLLYAKMQASQKAIRDFAKVSLRDFVNRNRRWNFIMTLIRITAPRQIVRSLQALRDPFVVEPSVKAEFFQLIPMLERIVERSRRCAKKSSVTLLLWRLMEDMEKHPHTFDLADQAWSQSECFVPMRIILYTIAALLQVSMEKRMTQIAQLQSAASYYRRAIYYFRRLQWQQCRRDLAAALDYNSHSACLHYAMATVLAILAPKRPQLKAWALWHLRQAFLLGWPHPDWPAQDQHFRILQPDPEFQKLVRRFSAAAPHPGTALALLRPASVPNSNWRLLSWLLHSYWQGRQQKLAPLRHQAQQIWLQQWQQQLTNLATKAGPEQHLHLFQGAWRVQAQKVLGLVYCQAATRYTQQGRRLAALRAYHQALEYDPNLIAVYIQRGQLYFQQGAYHAAVRDWQEALILQPRRPRLQALLSKAQAKLSHRRQP